MHIGFNQPLYNQPGLEKTEALDVLPFLPEKKEKSTRQIPSGRRDGIAGTFITIVKLSQTQTNT